MRRRDFLQTIGCSIAASPFVTPMAFASGPWENRLVVIILRGAMDGLDTVAPIGDLEFAKLRPSLGTQNHLALDGFYALHPALASLTPLWQAGEFGAVQAVSTPYRDVRSHFDGQDILEAGIVGPDGGARDGWLNRMIQTVPGLSGEVAYAIGTEHMRILDGDADISRWAPEARLSISAAAEQLLARVQHNDPLFRDASLEALEIAETVAAEQPSGAGYLRAAQFAANRLREETRIASFSVGGWDTHVRQEVALSRSLGRLAEVILTLKQGLGPDWQKTAVLCVTEFGRTVRENGTQGTDHGTGGAMLYAGGALRGRQVLGQWPGLTDLYAGRDLMPTRDIRAHIGWVMRGLFGLETSVIEGAVFPGLDLDPASGILL
ncbi:DUF1501 domain-containing protein [Flavimaricola marinus]|uniref:Twin-arginine translocation pathway signal n=1 Tax=Flavimaricola marinus TaxID=1819565 RepID=A0A238L884_9RHOB|nr:DUF1501 domain-containing protein [Flavimaricola marinus]SMY05907.1 hypothetical protein LOM8899_00028 [Flavimaricola marinus]